MKTLLKYTFCLIFYVLIMIFSVEASDLDISLQKGVNTISFPVDPLSSDVIDIFHDLLPSVELIQIYNTSSNRWLFFSPQLDGNNTLHSIPSGAGIKVTMKKEATLTLVASSKNQKLNLLKGWNFVGIKEESKTVRDLNSLVKSKQFSLNDDTVYTYKSDNSGDLKQAIADTELSVGEPFWVYNVVPQELYQTSEAETSTIGSFGVTVDSSNNVTKLTLPDKLAKFMNLDSGFAAEAIKEDGEVVGVLFSINLTSDEKVFKIAGIDIKGKQVSYGYIDEEGVMELGAEVELDGHKMLGTFIWDEKEDDSEISFMLALGKDTTDVMVMTKWELKNGAPERVCFDEDEKKGKWLLPLPERASGVFDLSYPFADDDGNNAYRNINSLKNFGKDIGSGISIFKNFWENARNEPSWVPLKLETDDETTEFKTLDGKIVKLECMNGLLKKNEWTDSGELKVTLDGKIELGKQFYQNGTMVYEPEEWLSIAFRGLTLVPEINVGNKGAVQRNSLVWSPGITVKFEDKGDWGKIEGGISLDASFVAGAVNKGGGASFKDSITNMCRKITRKDGTEPGKIPVGSSIELSPFAELVLGDESEEFPAIEQKKGSEFKFELKSDLMLGGLAGTPAYAHQTTVGAEFGASFEEYGDFSLMMERTWKYKNDKFFAGEQQHFEDKMITRTDFNIDFAKIFGWDDGKINLSLDWKTTQDYLRTGQFQNGERTIQNARVYLYKSQITGALDLESSANEHHNANGWAFSIKNAQFDATPREIGFDSSKYAMLRLMKTPWTKNPLKDIQKVTGDISLTPPDDLDWFPVIDVYYIFEALEVNNGKKWRKTICGEVDISYESDNLDIHIGAILFTQDPETEEWVCFLEGEVDFGEGMVGAMIYLERDGEEEETTFYVMLKFNADDYVKGNVSGRWVWKNGKFQKNDALYSGHLQIGSKIQDWFKEVFDDQTLEMQIGAFVQYGMGKVEVEIKDIPIDFSDKWPSWMKDVKIGDIKFVRDLKTKVNRIEVELDIKVDYFVDNAQPDDPEPWVKGILKISKGVDGKYIWHLEFDDIGPFDLANGATVTIKKLAGGKLNTGWELDGRINFYLPDSWKEWNVMTVPNEVTGELKYQKNRGFFAEIDWSDSPVIHLSSDVSIAAKGFIITKASPWGFGINTDFSFLGNTIQNAKIIRKNGSFMIQLPSNLSFHASIANQADINIQNLHVDLDPLDIGGSAKCSFKSSSPLHKFLSDELNVTISAGPDTFTLSTNIDLNSTIDFGKLGQGQLGLTSLSITVNNNGESFAVFGDIGLNNTTVDLSMGIRDGENFFFMCDFGEDGVGVEVAEIFAFHIRNKFQIATMFGVQYIEIDDMNLDIGNDIFGLGVNTKRFIYILPDCVPPVGFPFFDDFDGNVRMLGFGVNVGVEFPFPNEQDIENLAEVFIDAAADNSFDKTKVESLHAPKLALHDIAIKFPKVPGVTFSGGNFMTTDDQFYAIFNKHELTLISYLQLFGPSQIVDLAEAAGPYDLVKSIIPPKVRKGDLKLNLRGFADLQASYNFKQADLNKYNQRITPLPALDEFVQKVRYVDANTADEPAILSVNRGCKLLYSWGGSDSSLTHSTGEDLASDDEQGRIEEFLHLIGASPEVMSRNLDNAAFSTALVKAVFDRDPKSVEFPVYSDTRWVINPFSSAMSSIYKSDSTVNKAEDVMLASLLDKGISRGAAIDFLAASDTFMNTVIPAVKGKEQQESAYVSNAYTSLVGSAPPAQTLSAWKDYIHSSDPWHFSSNGNLQTPSVNLKKGFYKISCDVSATDNTSSDKILKLSVLNNGVLVNSQEYKGIDFINPGVYQSFYMPYEQLEGGQVAIKIEALGDVTVRDFGIYYAVKAQVDDVQLSSDLGGGNTQVKWNVVDVADEVNRVEDFLAFLTPQADSDVKDYLGNLWHTLVQKGGAPDFIGNKCSFEYSDNINVELTLYQDQQNDEITQLKFKGANLLARFGRLTLYAEENKKGKSVVVLDDLSIMSGNELGDNAVKSISIENAGKALLFAQPNFYGLSSSVDSDIDSMKNTDVGESQVSSVQVFYPVDFANILKWRLTARTIHGTIINQDAGGVEVVFPGVPEEMHVLTMLEGGRLKKSYTELSEVISDMKPNDVFNKPGDFLSEYWTKTLLPLKENVEAEGNTLKFTETATGIVHALTITKAGDDTVSAVGFDPAGQDGKNLLLLRGSANLFQNSNYQGSSQPVLNDIAELSLSQFADYGPYSFKLTGSAQLTFFPEPHFGMFPDSPDQTFGAAQFEETGNVEDGKLILRNKAKSTLRQIELNPGYYQIEVTADLIDKLKEKNSQVIGGFQSDDIRLVAFDSDSLNSAIEVELKSVKNGNQGYLTDIAIQSFAKNKFNKEKKSSFILKFDIMEKTWLNVNVKCLLAGTQLEVSQLALYQFQPNKGGVTFSSSNSYFGDCRKYKSLRVMAHTTVSDVAEWILEKRLPSGNNIEIAHGVLHQDNSDGTSSVVTGNTKISCTMNGSDNKLLLQDDSDNNQFYLIAQAADGYQFPIENYYFYTGNTPRSESNLDGIATAFHKFISKQIIIPENDVTTVATVNKNGGISATYRNTPVNPLSPSSKYSKVTMQTTTKEGIQNHNVQFLLSKGSDFGKARLLDGDKSSVPAYKNASGYKTGIKLPIPDDEKSGFYFDVELKVGEKKYVEIDVDVKGRILEDGNFFFDGNGDLYIANHVVSEAEITLGSKEGLTIKGKIDLGIAKVDIEGYLKPDGNYYFSGSAELMHDNTGVRGQMTISRNKLEVDGAIYVANHKIASSNFEIADGTISLTRDVGIGVAGFSYTFKVYIGGSSGKYGAEIDGRAYINISVPIKIYGVTSWKRIRIWVPFHHKHIKIPRHWGWITVGHIHYHNDLHVDLEVSSESVLFDIAIASLSYNIRTHHLSAHW